MANQIISKVYLLDTPLKNDYKDTFYFGSESAQQSYFNSKIRKTYTNVSYLRANNVIKLNEKYDDISDLNYLMYQNTAHSNKWIYCFIKNMKYISEGVTEIEIETDVIQTYLFDYTVHRSFVEREHVEVDAIGDHTIPEGLETGEYVSCRKPTKINSYEAETYICIAVSEMIEEAQISAEQEKRKYNGTFSGLYYIVCSNPENANKMIKIYDKKGKADAIYSIFIIPKEFVLNQSISVIMGEAEGIAFTFYQIPNSNTFVSLLRNEDGSAAEQFEMEMNDTLDLDYKPRNNKLLCYPYNYMFVTNNVGGEMILKYEDFKNPPTFKVIGAITPGCSTKCIPVGYKTTEYTNDHDESFDYGLIGGKFPICSWNSDSYTNWLTQNGTNMAVSSLGSAGMVAGGIALALTGAGTMAGVGMIAGGIMGALNSMSSLHQHSMIPDQAKGNASGGDVTFSSSNLCFTAYQLSIKKEYAEIIDQFFDKYGYKVNSNKIPNSNHRPEWWYTKTIGVNITGKIVGTDLQKIKDCYDQGITFWKNPGNIYRYDLPNKNV